MKPLSILVKIIPEREATLRVVLREIYEDVEGNRYIRFHDSPHTQFARFVVINDVDNGPRLLFTADFDGEYADYLRELATITLRPELLWGNCEGFAAGTNLPSFLSKHSEKNRGLYVAFQDETAQSIKTKIAIREQIEAFLDYDGVSRYLDKNRVFSFLDLLSRLPRPEIAPWTAFGQAVAALWVSIAKRLHDWLLPILLKLAKAFSESAVEKSFDRVTVFSKEEMDRIPTPAKNVTGQTSFTVFASVKPGLWWRLRLAIALPGTTLLGRYGYPPGNFANVFTLHSFRWLWIDNKKRIIFQSTFDGSWENYMADFVNNLVWALNALYCSCEGYPPGGMADVYRFEQWILEHQPRALVVYSAYPEETVLNLMKDRQISDLLSAHYKRKSVDDWLELL
jgi:hypothetical protein